MNRPTTVLAVMLAIVSVGCGSGDGAGADTTYSPSWQGTIETDGAITTVHTTGGSVWGAAARLVEELSIGVEIGDNPYMFGRVSSIYATDRKVYVVDQQVPAIRVYDADGTHLRDLGGEGQGPGEFLAPQFLAGTPDGRILLLDARRMSSVTVYGAGGEVLDPFRIEDLDGRMQCCLHPPAALADGSLLLEIRAISSYNDEFSFADHPEAVRRIYPDGAREPPWFVPRLGFVPVTFRYRNRFERAVPLTPELVWAVSPSGALIVGVSASYAFEVHCDDGAITRIVRDVEPVRVLALEEEWHRKSIEGGFGWSPEGVDTNLQWDGEIRGTKPAYRRFIPTASGEVWVVRDGPAEMIPDCEVGAIRHSGLDRVPPRCHETTRIVDAFELGGRYLGEIDVPPDILLSGTLPFVRDDVVWALVVDENEVSTVRRFRITTPVKGG